MYQTARHNPDGPAKRTQQKPALRPCQISLADPIPQHFEVDEQPGEPGHEGWNSAFECDFKIIRVQVAKRHRAVAEHMPFWPAFLDRVHTYTDKHVAWVRS